jgi:hypothetical protein
MHTHDRRKAALLVVNKCQKLSEYLSMNFTSNERNFKIESKKIYVLKFQAILIFVRMEINFKN